MLTDREPAISRTGMDSVKALVEGAVIASTFSGTATVIPVEQDIKRKPNFTDNEKLFIIVQYEQYKLVLQNRGASREKCEVWSRITAELNARNPNVHRTVQDVRKKWKNLVAQARKEFFDYRHAQGGGQGEVTTPSPFTFKILELMGEVIIQRNNDAMTTNEGINAMANNDGVNALVNGVAVTAVPTNEFMKDDPTDGLANNDAESDNQTSDKPIKTEPEDSDDDQLHSFQPAIELRHEEDQPTVMIRRRQDQPTVKIRVEDDRLGIENMRRDHDDPFHSFQPAIRMQREDYGVYMAAIEHADLSAQISTERTSGTETSSLSSFCGSQSTSCEDTGVVVHSVPKKRPVEGGDLTTIDDVRAVQDVTALKRMKLQLEAEKLVLENKKLALEIQILSKQVEARSATQS